MILFWIAVAAYLVVQTLVVARATGWRRFVAALPVLVMVPVILWTYLGVREGSNLAPMFFLLVAPFVLGILTWVMLRQDPTPRTTGMKE
jgi:hypothetical protein